MKRKYLPCKDHVKYLKEHGWKNQYPSIKAHGRFETNSVILKHIMGVLWVVFGRRVM